LTDWQHTTDDDRRVGLTHGLLNIGATALYITALSLRRGGARDTGRLLAGAGFVVTMAAAYIGGHLVFRKRLGVDHAERPGAWQDFVAVLREDALEEGQPRRVETHGVSIALVRRHGRVYAIGDRCAHLGGPLSEGAMEGDAALRCPWHGSVFALEDGRVLEGPSTYPQPCFETARARRPDRGPPARELLAPEARHDLVGESPHRGHDLGVRQVAEAELREQMIHARVP
jgi:nitrite reductase/ring-hydroxylating ferredoxin subunit